MSRLHTQIALSLMTASMLAACGSTKSSSLVVEPKVTQPVIAQDVPAAAAKWVHVDGGQRQLDFNPKIDILFVVDDSDSMTAHQENLEKNFGQFMAGLQKNKMIDYHVGVTSVGDTTQRAIDDRQKAHDNKGLPIYALGELRPVKNSKGLLFQERFITRTQDSKQLASTIHIGITPYADGGPEIEEMFSPISAALKLTGHGATNEGFIRDEAHLAVVIVSDADDSSLTPEITPDGLAQELFDFKAGNKALVSSWGVLVDKDDKDTDKDWGLRRHPKYHPECFDFTSKKDKKGVVTQVPSKTPVNCPVGFGPDRIEKFIVASNPEDGSPSVIRKSHIMDITQDDFGKDLLRIGSEITIKVLTKEIALDQIPDKDASGQFLIQVRYGTNAEIAANQGQLIPGAAKQGWVYDPEHNSIHIAGDVKYVFREGGRFDVMYVPVVVSADAAATVTQ